ncbi:hypothetical protein G7Y89_g14068 [Cudoniella acicularis]|uniref:Cytochrome P450 n=1 Tax=Cudoniella acicularis TaxID=354080 RepID=A0A8H4VXM1_9HELO|nr:hypothetical protein G7Y89_g14068 [Cudoniella acicularis]
MWTILYILKDPTLLTAIRSEISTAYSDAPFPSTLDVEKLVSLPLLQSTLTEALRLHMNFNLMRNVNAPINMDGYTLRKGAMLQAPMLVAHYDEEAWGSEGHPASVFWAERHIRYKEERDEAGDVVRRREFVMAGRPSAYFPFGGGQQICPGRHFAKHEILITIALLVSKFEIEVVGWTKLDGSPSEREAGSDARFSGAGAMPPDRDLKMRWKKIK